MPCIWGQHNGSQLFIPVIIIPHPVIPDTHTSHQSLNALVDTGATTTALADALPPRLNLQPVGKLPVQGVGGLQAHNSYLFMVGFGFPITGAPGAPPPPPGHVTAQVFCLNKVVQGCEIRLGPKPPFDVLLGMDVISTGSLVVQGNNTFSFSF
jgi:hypothetical protein